MMSQCLLLAVFRNIPLKLRIIPDIICRVIVVRGSDAEDRVLLKPQHFAPGWLGDQNADRWVGQLDLLTHGSVFENQLNLAIGTKKQLLQVSVCVKAPADTLRNLGNIVNALDVKRNILAALKKGKLARAILDTTVSGIAFDMLKTVDMVSDEMVWSSSGFCGKKQPMPVGMGGPALKCRAIIGGR